MHRLLSRYFLYYPATALKGERVFKYLKEYNENQYLPKDHLRRHGWEKLQGILDYSARFSPYYRTLLDGHTLNDDQDPAEVLQSIPLLEKRGLIENLSSLKTIKSRLASQKTTGGSTGEPVKLYKNPEALARERAATWRAYEWAGVKIGDMQARFWGVHHNRSTSAKARLIDLVANRYRISAFDLREEQLEHYYRQLSKIKPVYLYGYVSAVVTLTKFAQTMGYPPIASLSSIITTSELLTNASRRLIEQFWGVKVFNEYGCGEVGSIAHECEYGRMHLMADNLHLEILDSSGNPATTGEVVLTDYFNQAMPLIRYRVGDYATLSNESCACGRTLPVLKNMHGRVYDLVRTPSGKDLHPEAFLYIFEDLQSKYAAFSQFQVVQTAIDRLSIRIVRTSSWHDGLLDRISKAINAYIDPGIECDFAFVDKLEREKSGKVRVVKSTLSSWRGHTL